MVADQQCRGARGLHAREIAADYDLTVRLKREGIDLAVDEGRKAGVERAVGVKTRDITARDGIAATTPCRRKRAADQDRTVGLHADTVNIAFGMRIEFGID